MLSFRANLVHGSLETCKANWFLHWFFFFFFISQKKKKSFTQHAGSRDCFLSQTSKQALCLSEMGGCGGSGDAGGGGGGNWEIQNGKGERHKSVRKMMNGGRRQRFEGCMHWQRLEASATLSPQLNQRMRWKEWKGGMTRSKAGWGCHVRGSFQNTDCYSIVKRHVLFLFFLSPPHKFIARLSQTQKGVDGAHAGPASFTRACGDDNRRACMRVWRPGSLYMWAREGITCNRAGVWMNKRQPCCWAKTERVHCRTPFGVMLPPSGPR